MNILRTIIRFAIILVFLVLLVFLSVTLFKLIPLGINQLATASLSITGLDNATTTTTTVIDRTPQYVATTTGGLNGVVTQSVGDIVISDKPTTVKTNTVIKTVYVPRYYPTPSAPTYTYTGLKNIKASLLSVGIIDRYTGQYVSTNSYTSNDTIVVKYQISNDQDTATGPFTMRVDMPATDYNDQSKTISNINIPGRSSYNVEARFNGLNTSVTPVVRIYTDVNNNVYETNENDNTLSVTLNNVVNNTNYNNNCSYYSNGYYYNNCNTNNNYGQPNLLILSAETGKFVNGVFVTQNNFNYGDAISIKLRVRNTGGSFTNTWSTRTTYYDTNGSFREKVTTGERYLGNNEETTLTFNIDNINRGTINLTTNIDSNNNVYETNENDNTVSLNVNVY